jgi:hypothetical protein
VITSTWWKLWVRHLDRPPGAKATSETRYRGLAVSTWLLA